MNIRIIYIPGGGDLRCWNTHRFFVPVYRFLCHPEGFSVPTQIKPPHKFQVNLVVGWFSGFLEHQHCSHFFVDGKTPWGKNPTGLFKNQRTEKLCWSWTARSANKLTGWEHWQSIPNSREFGIMTKMKYPKIVTEQIWIWTVSVWTFPK